MNPIIKVIELSGILDGIKGDELRRKVTIVMANKADIVLIDLKDVKFVDNSGLSALISAMQIVRNANGELFVCSVSNQLQILFELIKMERTFRSFANRDEFNRFIRPE